MIEFRCPHCNEMVATSDESAGQEGLCDHCGQPVAIPARTPGPAPAADPPAPPSQRTRLSKLAITSLAFGIAACPLYLLGAVAAVPGIIAGHTALSRIRRQPERLTGRLVAVAGLTLSWASLTLFLLTAISNEFPADGRPEAVHRASCQRNLQRVGIAFRLFTAQHGGLWPRLSPEPGRLMLVNDPDDPVAPFYPKCLADPSLMVCPSDTGHAALEESGAMDNPNAMLDDHSYFYLGYVVTSDADVEAFADAYRQRIAQGVPFDTDLEVAPGSGNAGGNVLYRLHRDAARILAADPKDLAAQATAQSKLPVLIERPGNHVPEGGNVLYMDGHVEWKSYPGDWPMTKTTIRILDSLDAISTPPNTP